MYIELKDRTSTDRDTERLLIKIEDISVVDECEHDGCNIQVYNIVYAISESYDYIKLVLEEHASKK